MLKAQAQGTKGMASVAARGEGGVHAELWQLLQRNLEDEYDIHNAVAALSKGGYNSVKKFENLDEEDFEELQQLGLKPAVKRRLKRLVSKTQQAVAASVAEEKRKAAVAAAVAAVARNSGMKHSASIQQMSHFSASGTSFTLKSPKSLSLSPEPEVYPRHLSKSESASSTPRGNASKKLHPDFHSEKRQHNLQAEESTAVARIEHYSSSKLIPRSNSAEALVSSSMAIPQSVPKNHSLRHVHSAPNLENLASEQTKSQQVVQEWKGRAVVRCKCGQYMWQPDDESRPKCEWCKASGEQGISARQKYLRLARATTTRSCAFLFGLEVDH